MGEDARRACSPLNFPVGGDTDPARDSRPASGAGNAGTSTEKSPSACGTGRAVNAAPVTTETSTQRRTSVGLGSPQRTHWLRKRLHSGELPTRLRAPALPGERENLPASARGGVKFAVRTRWGSSHAGVRVPSSPPPSPPTTCSRPCAASCSPQSLDSPSATEVS